MPDSRPEVRQLVPRGITRSGAMKVCLALLTCSAVLIVMDRRGLLEGVVKEVAGEVALALALAGVLYLIHIWWAKRFQVSIGRLMLVVALIAVLFQGLLVYRQWIKRSLPVPAGARAAPQK
jgi:hypothetical protein